MTALPRTERLALLLGVVVLGLGASRYLPLPSPVVALRLPGIPSIVTLTLTPVRQVSLVVGVLVCALVDDVVRHERRLASAGLSRTLPYWVLPVLLVLAAFSRFEALTGPAQQVAGLASSALVVGATVVAQMQSLDPGERWFAVARPGLYVLSYALALAAYYGAETLPLRAFVAIPLVALISALLAMELLRSSQWSTRRTWGWAALVGLMMAEVAWALGPGVLSPRLASLVLLAVFYVLTGVLQQHLWGRLQRQVALEFAAMAAVALVVLVRLGG